MFEWKAVYDDGTELKSSDGTYLDIDRKKLKEFWVLFDGVPKVKVHLRQGQRLIYRLRVIQHLGHAPRRIAIVGWQETKGGENIQLIALAFEDGHVEIMDKFREGIYRPINLRPEEK